jgi:hypothetical protein
MWINNKDLWNVRNYYSEWAKHLSWGNLSLAGLFIDNHDNPRFLSN